MCLHITICESVVFTLASVELTQKFVKMKLKSVKLLLIIVFWIIVSHTKFAENYFSFALNINHF